MVNFRSAARAAAVAAAAICLLSSGQALGEDIKGKFYVGGDLGVLVTTDNIRNNAALLIAPVGADGAPFTGDQGEIISCESGRDPNNPGAPGSGDAYCDPRPDDLIARQTTLEQTLRLNATVGYGLTSFLSVQLDTGYYKGGINNFDVFTHKVIPMSFGPNDPCLDPNRPFDAPNQTRCELTDGKEKNVKSPISAGTVKEIPVMLSAILRFRKDSNFNPYLGAGAGYMFTSLDVDESVEQLNNRLSRIHLISTTDEFGDFGRLLSPVDGDGNAPFLHPASVTIEDGFQWHVTGGGEYFFSDRMSLVFDARYVVAGEKVEITLGKNEDQVNLETFYPEEMFRKDGSLYVYLNTPKPPNPLMPPDPNNPSAPPARYFCDPGARRPPQDYNGDGRQDACYFGSDILTETVVVQGGTIRLTNFTFGFGVRFHF